jgi:F-type H+-transporting ATPase subunit b
MHNAFLAAAAEEPHNPLIPAPADLIWATVAFAIILVFFIWKVVPRFTKLLDERSDAIEGGIKRAEEAQAAAEASKDEYEAQLAEARAEAARIREAARGDGDKIIAEKKEQASVEAARILAAAQAQIEAERAAAQSSLRAEVGSLALDLASNVIGETLNDDKKATALVDRFLADLEASETETKKA